jgi:Rrf2 family protein
MLTQTAEYALRAVVHIAGRSADTPVGAAELAADLGLPANYLAKILHQLVRAGILHSRRGRHGGFVLAVPAAELAIDEVIAPFERVPERPACLLGRAVCSDRAPCAAHQRWQAVTTTVRDFYRTTTVATLLAGTPPGPARRRHRGPAAPTSAAPRRR